MTTLPDRYRRLRAELDGRAEQDRLRRLERYEPEAGTPFVSTGEERLLSFCSNDYLGLATHPDVVAGAVRAANELGAGSGASRLVVGSFPIHERLERALAELTGREAALLFSSGFQANTTVIPAVVPPDGLVLYDEAAHASIRRGAWLSRARHARFRHNDIEHLEALLTERASATPGGDAPGTALIVTESLFSMDGDRAPLTEICEVAERHGALLMVDDAHAVGVHGASGAGLAAAHERVDLTLGTFGKALGSSGAFVACSALLRDHLVNFCAGVVYTTAPAPPALGAAEEAVRLVRSGALELDGYLRAVDRAHARIREAGFNTAPSTTQIVPIRLGDARTALACQAHLRERGILAIAIRPPTVPEGAARLRISLSRLHAEEHTDALVEGLVSFAGAGHASSAAESSYPAPVQSVSE